MGKSDQHKKLVETSGEKTLDFLIGAIWEGMSRKRDPQIPLIPCKRRVSVFTWVYTGSKKKKIDIDFPAKLGNFKTLLFFHQKKKKLDWPDFQKIAKIQFSPGAGLDQGFL